MKTVKILILAGFELRSYNSTPFQHIFTAFLNYEIGMYKDTEDGSGEAIVLKIKSTENLDNKLKLLRN
jgi:hypothetical protein